MSLDVYLKSPEPVQKSGTGVYARVDGQTKELTLEECSRRWTDQSFHVHEYETNEFFHSNITHNLGEMAVAAGIYKHLWRPEELNITTAQHLIMPLASGLLTLQSDPATFKALNPANGWGDYDGLVRFVKDYLHACIEYPDALIRVSR